MLPTDSRIVSEETPRKDVQAVNDEEPERSSGVHLSRVSGEEGQVNQINQRWVIAHL